LSGIDNAPGGKPLLCALEEHEIPELRAFLARILKKSPDIRALRPECLRWKYFQPRPDWHAHRSWAYRGGDGGIVAHIGVWPIQFVLRDTAVATMMNIDWAAVASRDSRGLGVQILDEVSGMLPLRFGVGGTRSAQRSVTKRGYVSVGSLDTYWRVLRPWKQLTSVKEPLRRRHIERLLRGWSADRRVRKLARGWSADHISSFEALRPLMGVPAATDWTTCARSPEMLDYMLSCPADCKAFLLRYHGEPLGYVLLSRNDTQVRIADLWIASQLQSHWEGAFAVVADAARTYADARILTALCSTETLRNALLTNRFQPNIQRPIWLMDTAGTMREARPLHLQALEADSWLL
jgi:hypothetical protein